jgi:protein SCO1/2
MCRYSAWVLALALAAGACSRPAREFQLQGQILAVDEARREVTIKHGDIPGFMPGMTMAFKVKDGGLLAGRVPGELVRAALVVEESEAYLRTLERTGAAPLSEPAPLSGKTLGTGELVQDASLVDETGAPWTLDARRGQVVAITFMYTRCPLPAFCPLMDRHFKAVQDQIGRDPALNGRVQLLSVTLDPEYDTPEVLARHAASLGAKRAAWHFATGPRAELERFWSQFGVVGAREDSEVVHNLRTAVIDGRGQLAAVLNGGDWVPSDLMAAIREASGR